MLTAQYWGKGDRRTIEKGKAALVRQGYRFGEINAAVRAFLEEQLEEE